MFKRLLSILLVFNILFLSLSANSTESVGVQTDEKPKIGTQFFYDDTNYDDTNSEVFEDSDLEIDWDEVENIVNENDKFTVKQKMELLVFLAKLHLSKNKKKYIIGGTVLTAAAVAAAIYFHKKK